MPNTIGVAIEMVEAKLTADNCYGSIVITRVVKYKISDLIF
jgi:hypothetical protein